MTVLMSIAVPLEEEKVLEVCEVMVEFPKSLSIYRASMYDGDDSLPQYSWLICSLGSRRRGRVVVMTLTAMLLLLQQVGKK